MMDDIAKQLAIRDSFRRKLAMRKSGPQRMREMFQRQREMFPRGNMSPEGYASFLQRNFKKRAVDFRESNDA